MFSVTKVLNKLGSFGIKFSSARSAYVAVRAARKQMKPKIGPRRAKIPICFEPIGPPSVPNCPPAEKKEEKPCLLIAGTSRLYVAPPYDGPTTCQHMQIFVKTLTPGYESYYQSDIKRAAATALGKADFQANLATLCDMASAEIQGNGAAVLPYLTSGANATIFYRPTVDEALQMLDFVIVVIRRLTCSEMHDQTILEEIAETAKRLFSAFDDSIVLAGLKRRGPHGGEWVVNPAILSVDQLMEFLELALEIELSIGVSHHSLSTAGYFILQHYTMTGAFTPVQKHRLVYMFSRFNAHSERDYYGILPRGVMEKLTNIACKR